MIKKNRNEYTAGKHRRYIFIFELIGTFLFTFALGCPFQNKELTASIHFVEAVSLLLTLAFAGQVSGGYFNSTVSIAAFLNKKHKLLGTYVLAQTLGGALGVVWYYLMTGKMKIVYGRQTDLDLAKYLLNELIGSTFFCVCVLTLTNKFTTHAYKSWQIYISISAAFYMIRRMTGDTPINPTTSIFYQVGSWLYYQQIDYLIDVWVLIVPSTIGGVFGGLLMHKIYEPLLLSIRFKDEAQRQKEGNSARFITETIVKS